MELTDLKELTVKQVSENEKMSEDTVQDTALSSYIEYTNIVGRLI